MTTFDTAASLGRPFGVAADNAHLLFPDYTPPRERLRDIVKRVKARRELGNKYAEPEVVAASMALAHIDAVEEEREATEGSFFSTARLVGVALGAARAAIRMAVRLLVRAPMIMGRLAWVLGAGAARVAFGIGIGAGKLGIKALRFTAKALVRTLAVAGRIAVRNPYVAALVIAAGAGYWAYKRYVNPPAPETEEQKAREQRNRTAEAAANRLPSPTPAPSERKPKLGERERRRPRREDTQAQEKPVFKVDDAGKPVVTEEDKKSKPPKSAKDFEGSLLRAMDNAGITDHSERAMFLAQAATETAKGKFLYEIWNPEQSKWQKTYEGRKDLGNTQPGDGYRYRGRGFFQLTGRYNYAKASKALGIDLVNYPDLAAREDIAALTSVHFWKTAAGGRIPAAARKGDNFAVTGYINGRGREHLDRREKYYREYLKRTDISATTTRVANNDVKADQEFRPKPEEPKQVATNNATAQATVNHANSLAPKTPIKVGNQIYYGQQNDG